MNEKPGMKEAVSAKLSSWHIRSLLLLSDSFLFLSFIFHNREPFLTCKKDSSYYSLKITSPVRLQHRSDSVTAYYRAYRQISRLSICIQFLKSVYNDEWTSFSPTAGLVLSAVPVFVFVSAAGNLFSSRQWLDDVAEGEIKGERKSRKVVPHKSECTRWGQASCWMEDKQ